MLWMVWQGLKFLRKGKGTDVAAYWSVT